MDFPNPLSPPVSIVHCSWEVFQTTSCIGTELLYIGSSWCYAIMCSVGLKGAIRSCQVHQLKQGTHVGCGLPTLFSITNITNSLAEPHFKATRQVIGELLKVNTANWLALPPQIQGLRQIQYFLNKKKDSELPCLGQQD